jgi:hypothetical protein
MQEPALMSERDSSAASDSSRCRSRIVMSHLLSSGSRFDGRSFRPSSYQTTYIYRISMNTRNRKVDTDLAPCGLLANRAVPRLTGNPLVCYLFRHHT